MPQVIVVGAGPAGLATAAELGRRGVDAVVLERGPAPAARWRSRYDGLRLNTYRGFSHLPSRRLPQTAGRYATRDAFVAYLDDYVRHHSLDIRLGVEAGRIDRTAPHGYTVATGRGPMHADSVVIATGWDAVARIPAWAAASPFAGPVLHTSELTDLSRFADQRVLVVGAGNSGVDVAGLLVRAGATVTMSMRTPPNIFPRDWLGIPLGPSVRVAEHLPSALSDPLGRLIQRHVYGDLSAYGIPRPPAGYMTRFRRAGTNPAVDDGFIAAVKTHRATIVGEVQALETGGARLVSGQSIETDAIICATGYRRGLEPLVGHLDVLDRAGAPRHPRGAPCDPCTPGLYFAGFQVALSGSIRLAGVHARRIAKAITASAGVAAQARH